MDAIHRSIEPEPPSGRTCDFCRRLDPDFQKRNPLDQLVRGQDTASRHLTEDGHVQHRILELRSKLPAGEPDSLRFAA